jgi:integrase
MTHLVERHLYTNPCTNCLFHCTHSLKVRTLEVGTRKGRKRTRLPVQILARVMQWLYKMERRTTVQPKKQNDCTKYEIFCTSDGHRKGISMTKIRNIPTYLGGFDPGTGRAGLTLVSADGVSLENDTMTIDSIVATGNAEKLLKRGDIHATLADVLREDECLITFNSTDYFLCSLVKEGKNSTNAVADPARYWGDHARVLLLALACTLIPERVFALRLVTALPVTLYDRDNRKRMKEALSSYYRFEYNGRVREVYVTVGYVAMEGQGALIHCGAQDGEQALLDIGERTVDAIAADGQKLMISLCGGNEELGVVAGSGSIYQRSDDRGKKWVASFIVEETGKRKYIYKDTRKEAHDALQEALQAQKQGTLATGRKQKFKDYLVRWFEEVQKPDLRDSSIERYENCIYKHILPALGHVELQKLTAQQIQSFYTSKRKAGYAPESIITLHKVIHKSLDNAVRWRLIPRNVSDDVTLPKHGAEGVAQSLTVQQVRHLLKTVKGHELEAMIVLLLDTGMRHGEITALRWEDINFEKGTIYIHRTESRLKQGHVEGKTKTATSERVITLSSSVIAVLQEHRMRQREMQLAAASQWQHLDLVFANKEGKYLEKLQNRKKFYMLLEQAGLPRIRIHDLRHTAITLMMEMGINQKAIQERVGHARIDETWKYTHVSESMEKEIAARLDTLLWGENPSN